MSGAEKQGGFNANELEVDIGNRLTAVDQSASDTSWCTFGLVNTSDSRCYTHRSVDNNLAGNESPIRMLDGGACLNESSDDPKSIVETVLD